MEINPTKRWRIRHQNGTSGWSPEEILLVRKSQRLDTTLTRGMQEEQCIQQEKTLILK